MDMETTVKLDLTFDQILSLVNQLSKTDKIKLVEELEKEMIDSKFSSLLQTFKTEDLDFQTITEEVEKVRQEIYDQRKG